jgi:uncharacterized DUF497 family protein
MTIPCAAMDASGAGQGSQPPASRVTESEILLNVYYLVADTTAKPHTVRDDNFEWDDAKAAANLARHGVSFEMAREVFDDRAAYDREDTSMNYGEDRFLTVGLAARRLLSVAWTSRGSRVRIISVRMATAKERRAYHGR